MIIEKLHYVTKERKLMFKPAWAAQSKLLMKVEVLILLNSKLFV